MAIGMEPSRQKSKGPANVRSICREKGQTDTHRGCDNLAFHEETHGGVQAVYIALECQLGVVLRRLPLRGVSVDNKKL